ncbi:hypothetical protein P168DRAFT_301121 [Aspergillus campestris IBT 28561]|uniref:Mid2 domain-containing protein n=1 Tax=Aspergillus campestris (strain IBT 28561) TaxID=1392248 RepID=A0A2I1DEW9_ASPC2|nr:uncharacterized protein P168DRAFT_301121 [Aspergillus campestris IBT 28561]PKY08416.1 hypothetical protein P168DRAFT_301121 [Aspergillus campestris IBT 28561]
MTRLPSIIAAALCALPLTHAWTLKWENHTNGGMLNLGEKPKGCTVIYHEKGEQFSWDPEGLFCLRLFIDTECENPGGETCNGKPWKKDASKDLAAFSVRDMPESSMSYYGLSSATPFPTTQSKPDATPTADDHKKDDSKNDTKDDTKDNNTDNSSTGLSSGGIAGIVVGIVAGVGILAGLIFFLWRRGRGAKAIPIPETPAGPPPSSPGGASTNPDQSTFAASAAGAYGSSEKGDVPELHSPNEHPQGPAPPSYQPVVMAELAAGDVQSELSNTNQVVEMDAQEIAKRPVYRDT